MAIQVQNLNTTILRISKKIARRQQTWKHFIERSGKFYTTFQVSPDT